MNFQVEYSDGSRYECRVLAEIDMRAFQARGIVIMFYGGVSLCFDSDEVTIAHRKRRILTMGDIYSRDFYILVTNKRKIIFLPDGSVFSIPEGGETHVAWRNVELTEEEQEFAHQNHPVFPLTEMTPWDRQIPKIPDPLALPPKAVIEDR